MDLLAAGSAITWLAGLLGDGLSAAGLVELAAGVDPSFRRDLADATRRAVSGPRDGDAHYFARGAALIAAPGLP